MSTDGKSNIAVLIAFVVVSMAVVGYFTGMQSPMNASRSSSPPRGETVGAEQSGSPYHVRANGGVLPATHYAEMADVTFVRQADTRLASLKASVDPLEEITVQPGEKVASLQQRDRNRAFNGAPPTIPHPIEQRSDASCVACHGEGAKTASLRIPRMSHALLTNCTQCHVENRPLHMAATAFRANEFSGLAAPTEGPRAYSGAPPQIPHSTWMRGDCLSCHGHTGLQGIRTTHPWRSNCQQCHAPSASMEQSLLPTEPQFLPGPRIEQ